MNMTPVMTVQLSFPRCGAAKFMFYLPTNLQSLHFQLFYFILMNIHVKGDDRKGAVEQVLRLSVIYLERTLLWGL